MYVRLFLSCSLHSGSKNNVGYQSSINLCWMNIWMKETDLNQLWNLSKFSRNSPRWWILTEQRNKEEHTGRAREEGSAVLCRWTTRHQFSRDASMSCLPYHGSLPKLLSPPSAMKVLKSFYRSSLTLPYLSLLSCPISFSPILKTTFALLSPQDPDPISFLLLLMNFFEGEVSFQRCISLLSALASHELHHGEYLLRSPWGALGPCPSWPLCGLLCNPDPHPFPSFSSVEYLPSTCLYVLSQDPLSTSMPSTFTEMRVPSKNFSCPLFTWPSAWENITPVAPIATCVLMTFKSGSDPERKVNLRMAFQKPQPQHT